MEKLPAFDISHYIFNLFEKENVTGTSNNQTFSSEHDHLSQIMINNFLKAKLVWLIWFDEKAFSLSVKGIDFVPCFGVEAGVRKVCFVRSHSLFSTFASDSSVANVPYEMIMGQLKIIKEIDENFIVSNEATRNIWFRKAFIYHRVVIDPK